MASNDDRAGLTPADELFLERVAEAPEAVSAEENARLRRLLSRHPDARDLLAFFRAFYADAESAPKAAAARVTLTRMRPRRDDHGLPAVLLASTAEEDGRFRETTVFASETDNVVLRIVYDQQAACYYCHMLATEPEKRAHVLLVFEDIDLYVVTDDQGRAIVHEDEVAMPSVSGEAFPVPTVHLAVAASQPVEEDGSYREWLATGHDLHLVRRRGAVNFTLHDRADALPIRFAVVCVGDEQIVVPYDDVGEVVDTLLSEGTLIVRFY